MSGCLIRGGRLITQFRAGGSEAIDDGALAVRGGRIAEVGAFADLAARHPGLPVHGRPGDIALPGLVNAHHHMGLTPFQLGAPDLPLELWAVARMGARDVDPWLDTVAGAADLIAAGVTSVVHILDAVEGPPEAVHARLDAILRAYRDIGLRAAVAYGIADRNLLPGESDTAFLAHLPAGLRRRAAAAAAAVATGADAAVAVTRDLARAWAGADRVRLQFGLANLHWCTPAACAAVAAASAETGLGVQMHLLETPWQRAFADRHAPGGIARALGDAGLLSPRLTVAHGVWLRPGEIEGLADAGVTLCLNPSSNLRLGSGLAPVTALRAAGLTLAVGIDEAGLADDRDLFQELRLLSALGGPGAGAAGAPAAGDLLAMATRGGARAAGWPEAGVLAPGAPADVTLIDARSLAGLHLDPGQPLDAAIVRRARPAHVRAVICDGLPIYEEGRFLRLDVPAARAELAARLGRPLSPAERGRRDLARRLLPHARRCLDDRFPMARA